MGLSLYRDFVSAVVVLSVIASVQASPTVPARPQPSFTEVVVSGVSTLKTSHNIGCLQEFSNSTLAEIGREIFKPSTDYAGFSSTANNQPRSLPVLPGAILMGIVGFLCVSMVRDRKTWVSVFTGIILVSQTGIQTLPRLTTRLAAGKLSNKQVAALTLNPNHLDFSFDGAGNLSDLHYIGLLHRLAASPDGDSAFGNIIRGAIYGKAERKLSDVIASFAHRDTISSPPAVIPVRCSLNPLAGSLARRITSFICFSPAFIFANLARGPPVLA